MQGHRGRITRKELKEDEFVTRAVQVSEYIQQNYPKVLAGIGAVVVVILIGVFIKHQIEIKNRQAVEAMGAARIALASGNIQDAVQKAQHVVDDYSGKPQAARAELLLGDIHFGQRQFAKARRYYENYLDQYGSEGPGGYAAWTGVAACIEEQGDLTEAGREYLAYVDRQPESPFAAIALSEAGRCFEDAGDRTQAEATFRRILKEYPKHAAARSAQAELALMGVQP